MEKSASQALVPELSQLVRLINEDLAGVPDDRDVRLEASENTERQELGRYLCLELRNRPLALSLESVVEAGELVLVQPLPLLPPWHAGIINVRGEIISAVNLSLFLDLGEDRVSKQTRPFIIVRDEVLKIAIIVDRILGTRSLYRDSGTRVAVTDASGPAMPLLAGSALYEDQERIMEIDIFDLEAFLALPKLVELAFS